MKLNKFGLGRGKMLQIGEIPERPKKKFLDQNEQVQSKKKLGLLKTWYPGVTR